MSSTRSYADAVDHLNSLQSNAATLDAVRASGGRLSEFAIPEMLEYLGRIGYEAEDLNALNVIHVTGTKGKGSTCAFTNSILRHVKPEWRVGLYTSPHLVAVRERIRVNGSPISEEDFARFFFEVWDRLDKNEVRAHPSTPSKPAYFRFVTLVAFHAFLSLKVDATILEVGVGGAYDSTNIVPRPTVTGVSALGIDHVGVLGKTIPEIAWQKAGIYKPGVPALTVEQPEEGMKVLEQRAAELKTASFEVVHAIPALDTIRLGLSGAHQRQNAALAVRLAQKFLSLRAGEPELPADALPPQYVAALQATRWPGRCQTVRDPAHAGTTWFLDGAHTLESLECCVRWFVSPDAALRTPPDARPRRVLVFNCTAGRTGATFLRAMLEGIEQLLQEHAREGESSGTFFDQVVFCTNVTYASGNYKGDLTSKNVHGHDLVALKVQHELADAWRTLLPSFPADRLHVLPSVEHAVNIVRQEPQPVDVLVAGSLHLVGGIIEVAGLKDVAL
ncbi:FolC bifunctional protein [Phanerochaete sordida]|uniref:Folylpolyglutamate synthase n=1 Tax=Phanerochaete sordida TaxID=48140 RepID=A0A9P3L6U8_9APHY|nr:FolC bifunctional protein [Phanerochaete sordida]